MTNVRVLAISGSLRRVSSNTALVEAAVRLAPAAVTVSVYRQLEDLPAFNPDRDTDPAPEAVQAFRRALQASDAVLISSPEYAHGVPGALKNALDWVVSSGEFIDKPVAVVNASTRATRAWSSLVETLTVMSARVIRDAAVTVPLDGLKLDADGIAADLQLGRSIGAALQNLADAARAASDGSSAVDNIWIRPARVDERTALESLQRRASLNNPGDRDAILANPDAIELPAEQIASGSVFVAERGGVVAGFAALLPRPDGAVELDALFVEPDLWKQGIGRRLVDHLADVARLRAASVLHVVGNPHAEGFYRSCGFRVTGTVATRFGVGLDMRRPL